MDLIEGYLLIFIIIFAANTALLLGNYKINNVKLICVSAIFSIITYALIDFSKYLNITLIDYIAYLFLLIAVIILTTLIYYVKCNNFKISMLLVIVSYVVSLVLMSCQINIGFFNKILYLLLAFIILFIVYKLTNLLHHAKREYPIIVSEYMSLISILIFIFALTYDSTRNIDYMMFSSFLILTPTYQLIYVIIAIIVILIIGVIINDNKGGNS